MELPTHKKCTKCGEEKLLEEFYKSKKIKSGRQGHCIECDKKKGAEYYNKNSDKVNAKNKAHKDSNPDKVKEQYLSWYSNNKERNFVRSTKWRKENPERARELSRKSEKKNPKASRIRNEKRRMTPRGKLENAIRAGFHRGIKLGSKASRKTFELLGYTPAELMMHLERQFVSGMTWENHGRGEGCWHIDHHIPLSAFNFDTPDDIDFKLAWDLSNLRPLWEKDNLAKSNKIFVSFQPSLALSLNTNANLNTPKS